MIVWVYQTLTLEHQTSLILLRFFVCAWICVYKGNAGIKDDCKRLFNRGRYSGSQGCPTSNEAGEFRTAGGDEASSLRVTKDTNAMKTLLHRGSFTL